MHVYQTTENEKELCFEVFFFHAKSATTKY